MIQKTITTQSTELTRKLFGAFDSNVEKLEASFGVRIYNRSIGDEPGDTILVEGEQD